MKTLLIMVTLILNIFVSGMVAFGNPAMLPQHPGYPMGQFKDPVVGMPTANDPGKSAPTRDEALKQAAAFHDAHATNPMKEIRPNVVYEDPKNDAAVTANKQES